MSAVCTKCGARFEQSMDYYKHRYGPCKIENVQDYRLREEVKKLRRSARRQNKALRTEVAALTRVVTKLTEQLATSRE